jgi:hypothetical protein
MKTNMLTLASVAALTMSMAVPVYAGTTALTDEALDAVSGKSNSSFVGAGDNTLVNGSSANGNIQVGYYQWDDNHSGDSSTNKGGNIQSGDNSMVQQNANVTANTLAWGAVAQSITENVGAAIGNDQVIEDWATMYIGGF